jgi:hypothetical protein
MPSRNLTIACLALSVLLSGTACAKRLDTFAGSIDLPFDFHIKYRVDEASNSTLDFSASQKVRIVIDSGPAQGSEATVVAGYFVPSRGGDAQENLRRSAEQAAGKNLQSVQLGGFPFVLYTTDVGGIPSRAPAGSGVHGDDGGPARSTVMSGALNNAVLTLAFERPIGTALDAIADRAMQGFEPDFASILAARTHFDDAARAAVDGGKMLAPTGAYTVIGNLKPRLHSTWTKSDDDGRVVASNNSYSFARAGFWTSEQMEFGSSCSLEGGQDTDAVSRQRRIAPESRYSEVVAESPPVQARIGGLAAIRVDARVASTYSRLAPKSETSRWIATDRDTWYVFDFLASNGPAFENDLRSQIDAQPLRCAPGALLVLGEGSAQAVAAP